MILGIALFLLTGAVALPRGSGGMRGHFLRAQYADAANNGVLPPQSSPSVHQVFPSQPASSSLERDRRDEPIVSQANFLRPSQIQPSVAHSSVESVPQQWGRRDEPRPQLDPNDDFENSKQPFYPILSYSTKREDSGAYSYRFETADGLSREETSDVDLERSSGGDDVTGKDRNENIKRVVRGWYSYPSPNGEGLIRVDYIADENGFRATQTEQLKVNPVSRPSQRLFQTQPKPSRDDAHQDEPAELEPDRSSYSNSPSIYYRQLGQGGFFYSYRAPNALQ